LNLKKNSETDFKIKQMSKKFKNNGCNLDRSNISNNSNNSNNSFNLKLNKSSQIFTPYKKAIRIRKLTIFNLF